MFIITISGSHSGVGKTTLAALIISRLPGFAAVKVSPSDLFTSVTDEPNVISEPGKDTALMRDAGADPVVWVRSTPEELPESLSQALTLCGNARGAVVEGNGPARLIKPDLAFFVVGLSLEDAKPGALDVLAKADVVVVNVEADEPPDAVRAAVRLHNRAAMITTMKRMREPGEEARALIARFG